MAQKVEAVDTSGTSQYTRMCDLTDQLLKRDNDLTPDWLTIKLQKHHPLFVYGTLKTNGRLHEKYLKEFPTFGEGYTVKIDFIMKDVGGSFPAVVDAHGSSTMGAVRARVFGEIYIVPPEILMDLDFIEQNNRMFQRREHWVFLMDQSFKTKTGVLKPSIKCWMYNAMPSWINQTSSSLCIRKTGEGKLEKYWEWDNKNGNQLDAMKEIWKKNDQYVNEVFKGPLERAGIMTE